MAQSKMQQLSLAFLEERIFHPYQPFFLYLLPFKTRLKFVISCLTYKALSSQNAGIPVKYIQNQNSRQKKKDLARGLLKGDLLVFILHSLLEISFASTRDIRE